MRESLMSLLLLLYIQRTEPPNEAPEEETDGQTAGEAREIFSVEIYRSVCSMHDGRERVRQRRGWFLIFD